MISRLHVKGFKGFDRFDLPKLSRVTLLGGRNNVGKTSLLEALFMFFDRLNPQMILRQYAQRGVSVVPLEPETTLAPVFFNYEMTEPIVISVWFGKVEETMTLKFNPKYDRPIVHAPAKDARQIETDQRPLPSYALDVTFHRTGSIKQTYHFWTGPEGVGLHIDNASRNTKRVILLGSRAYPNVSEDAERFGKIDIVGKLDKILECLKIIEPKLKGLSSIALPGGSSLVHGDIGLSRKIPLAYMGEGTSRLLSIILGVANSDLLLIDELENGFHYSVMTQVWESIGQAAREFNCQIIGTTHSYECLQAAYKAFAGELEQDFTYVRIDRINDRAIAKVFDFDSLRTAIDSNMEVR
jgi:hypothetical protein